MRSSGPATAPAPVTAPETRQVRPQARMRLSGPLTAVLLPACAGSALLYALISILAAYELGYAAPVPVRSTPASIGLDYRPVAFLSRTDHLRLHGWLIPAQAEGRRSLERAIIVVHGTRQNRTDPSIGVLDLSGQLARKGFAVLAFDMRGMGESAPTTISFGQYEMRDVLGAADLLRTGPLPYPELGRPRFIGGWGVSMGAATVLLAAAVDPEIQAVVADSAYADILPLLKREVPAQGRLPPEFTPGTLLSARLLYGIDLYSVRPVDVVARLAPRPLLLIQGQADTYVPTSNLRMLEHRARSAPGAHVTSWLVPGATHGQAFHTAPAEYLKRVTAFFSSGAARPRTP